MQIGCDRLKYHHTGFIAKLISSVVGRNNNLKRLLRKYPLYQPPYLSSCAQLTLDQAESNFEFFLQNKTQRLQLLGDLLSSFGIQIPSSNLEVRTLFELDAWAYQYWPSIYQSSVADLNIYGFQLDDDLDKAIRSMLYDVSILLGELYILKKAKSKWVLIFEEEKETQTSTMHKRIVIKNPEGESLVNVDMEAQVYFHYLMQIKSPALIAADFKMGRTLAEPIMSLFD